MIETFQVIVTVLAVSSLWALYRVVRDEMEIRKFTRTIEDREFEREDM